MENFITTESDSKIYLKESKKRRSKSQKKSTHDGIKVELGNLHDEHITEAIIYDHFNELELRTFESPDDGIVGRAVKKIKNTIGDAAWGISSSLFTSLKIRYREAELGTVRVINNVTYSLNTGSQPILFGVLLALAIFS